MITGFRPPRNWDKQMHSESPGEGRMEKGVRRARGSVRKGSPPQSYLRHSLARRHLGMECGLWRLQRDYALAGGLVAPRPGGLRELRPRSAHRRALDRVDLLLASSADLGSCRAQEPPGPHRRGQEPPGPHRRSGQGYPELALFVGGPGRPGSARRGGIPVSHWGAPCTRLRALAGRRLGSAHPGSDSSSAAGGRGGAPPFPRCPKQTLPLSQYRMLALLSQLPTACSAAPPTDRRPELPQRIPQAP